jgi:hypothetical protein
MDKIKIDRKKTKQKSPKKIQKSPPPPKKI